MIIIDHRRNSIEQIRETPFFFGAEIDLRSAGNNIILAHDPFSEGVLFSEWLQHFNHRFLIVNVKEEGMEKSILSLLQEHDVSDFFILDESFPFIRKWALTGLSKFAVRVSEFEDKETALNLAAWLGQQGKKIDWVWMDSFTGAVPQLECVAALKAADLKTCFVSPELHHIDEPDSWHERVNEFIKSIKQVGIMPDAVCSKLPQAWQASFA